MDEYIFVGNGLIIKDKETNTAILVQLVNVDNRTEFGTVWEVGVTRHGRPVYSAKKSTLGAAVNAAKDALQAEADRGIP